MLNRRTLLKSLAASPLLPSLAFADDKTQAVLKGHSIVRVVGFRHVCPRPKYVGKNSHLGDHGDKTVEDCLRIVTDTGLEGIGIGHVGKDAGAKVVGLTLDQLWEPGVGAKGLLGRADHAVFDVVGKALGVPSWKLIGDAGPEWVRVYDGSIYFNDLRHDYAKDPVGGLVREVESSLEAGHRAFKIKVGRGYKWMERAAGDRRDIEVVQGIRKRVGKDIRLMVDGNNGFDLDGVKRWLDALGDDLYFVEEMFPEDPTKDRDLKDYLKSKGWKTLVADGESADEANHFDGLVAAGAIDVLQADIRGFGLTLLTALSRRVAKAPGVTLAPHNWGSFLGVYMQAVLARGIPNFQMAEQDRATSDLFDVSAFEFKDGLLRVPNAPGNGLVLREDVFRSKYAPTSWTVGN